LVADVWADVEGGEKTALANARLIAAAPDLLSALKDLLFNCDHGNGLNAWEKTKEKARAAISKAEGV